tara:strand:+ start:147 stop:476 length:330 start_codon:yes stop_codon:yes gene_type:complete
MERLGDSKLGKASIILSLIALLSIISKLVLFIIGVFLPVYSSTYWLNSPFFWLFISILGIIASLFGFCLGLAGIFQKTRVRRFAFIGTIISVALLCIYIFSGAAIILVI